MIYLIFLTSLVVAIYKYYDTKYKAEERYLRLLRSIEFGFLTIVILLTILQIIKIIKV